MRRHNVGLALRTNYWEPIEYGGSIVGIEDSAVFLDGFSVRALPRPEFCDCGNLITGRAKTCATCMFVLLEEKRERIRAKLTIKQQRTYEAEWRRMSLADKQMDLLRRNAERALPLKRKLLSGIARLSQNHVRPDRLRNMRSRTLDRAVNRVYVFLNYRLEHRPVSFYRGENSRAAKLTTAAVLDIRDTYAPIAGRSSYALSKKYGVSPIAVMQVVYGATWGHVGGKIIEFGSNGGAATK